MDKKQRWPETHAFTKEDAPNGLNIRYYTCPECGVEFNTTPPSYNLMGMDRYCPDHVKKPGQGFPYPPAPPSQGREE